MKFHAEFSFAMIAFSCFLIPVPGRKAESASYTSFCPGSAKLVVSQKGGDVLRFGTAAWAPDWAWAGSHGEAATRAGVATGQLTTTIGNHALHLNFQASQTAPNQLQLVYELTAEQDTDLTLFAVEIKPGRRFDGQTAQIGSNGDSRTLTLPLGKQPLGDSVDVLEFHDPEGQRTRLRFTPPCEITADGAVRLILAKDHLKAGPGQHVTVSVELPGTTKWYAWVAEMPDEPGIESWYPWRAAGDSIHSVISMTDWLEKPAGQHGRIVRENDVLLYHGKPIKLWGINLCFKDCAPEPALADQRAAFYPHYGINSVRLHKFADGSGWSGIQSRDSAAEYDPAGLDRMDYQVARFKESGIFVKLSAHFGTIKMGPADRRDVPFLDEFGKFEGRKNRVSAPHSAFFYSPELQQLQIRQMVNLLGHRNPHTGLTYAEDPAVYALEIINEQSILFYTSMAPLKASETLRHQVGERFSKWLIEKYGDSQGLEKAWGTSALDAFSKEGFPPGEDLALRNILPLGNPWYWDPQQLDGSQTHLKPRMLDTLRFLYGLQCEAYDRYVAAIRETGFGGEILGSNWQAGRALSHYANLHSDYRVGLIDRHNYFGGGRGGPFNADSMLARAGSGSLSSGLQQVEDRPFMLSEWIHVFPNEWGVEGPSLIGAYGMGLQGWDVSYLFQNGDQASFSPRIGRQSWDVMAPQILGIFPAVARQVLRGDVQESEVIAVRNVHLPSLFQGKLGFKDQVVQGYDNKELDNSKVPARALAVARCTVKFGDDWRETPAFDLSPYRQNGLLVSSTGQMQWKEGTGSTDGFFTLDSAATQAVVGFARDRTFRLGDVTLIPQSRFCALYVTAMEQHQTIASAQRLLIVAMARARNTGMKLGPGGDELLETGQGPVLMEPVKSVVQFHGRRVSSVRLLNHDGSRTKATLPVTNNEFMLNGATDRTPYYEVILE